MTFDDLNLNNSLKNALKDLEYIHPTPIQAEAFSLIMSGRDVVGVAQTGTGKTFAYLLPLLRLLKFSKEGHPRILIIVPTRELVVQVVNEIEKLTKYMTVRTVGVYGGTNINTQKIALLQGQDIVVATPGRLLDLGLHGALKLKYVKKLVIDEVDELLNLGFRTQLNNLLDLLPPKRQNLLFSATMTDDVDKIIDTFFNSPVKIQIVPKGTPLDQIIQRAYHVPNYNTKANLLEYLLKRDEEAMSKVLVFVGNKKLADRLHERLLIMFPEQVGVIHSNKSQNYRINAVNNFHDGTHRIIIATDIIARGIDVSDVSHVINFDTPEVPENYMHRIGRTGRADKIGEAITFINEIEQEYQILIEELMKKVIDLEELPEDLEISTELIEEEKIAMLGDKHYLQNATLKGSQGAFHDKLDKNKKVNRAKEKRMARKKEKQRSGRKKKR